MSKDKKDKKEKMVVMVPTSGFGYDRRAYRAGEKYIISQSKLPTEMKSKYKIEQIKSVKKQEKVEVKKAKKVVPILGK